MVKLDLKSPAVVLGVSFLLIFFAVFKQNHATCRERMTGSPKYSDDDKKAVMDYLSQSIIDSTKAKEIKLTANATSMLAFLDANPVTSIDDTFIANVSDIAAKMAAGNIMLTAALAKPGVIKDGIRTVAKLVVANVIWAYADQYEKLKEAPTQTEFRTQLSEILRTNSQFQPILRTLKDNLRDQDWLRGNMERDKKALTKPDISEAEKKRYQESIDRNTQNLNVMSLQNKVLGDDTYPLGGSASPTVNQMFDIAYKYYFGDTFSASGAFSAMFTALFATFGTIGGIAIILVVTKYVLKLW
jgi:hypothetical protein